MGDAFAGRIFRVMSRASMTSSFDTAKTRRTALAALERLRQHGVDELECEQNFHPSGRSGNTRKGDGYLEPDCGAKRYADRPSSRPGIKEEIESLPLEDVINGLNMPGFCPGVELYAALLRRCGNTGSMVEGTRVHEHILKNKMEGVRYLGNMIMEMYGKCGDVREASTVFKRMAERNVYSWTIIIVAHAQNGHPLEALDLFYRMQQDGIAPNNHTFSIAIASCSTLLAKSNGRKIHASMEGCGFEPDAYVKNTLMDFYTKCGNLDDVRTMFWSIRDEAKVVSWTCMIVGCVQLGSYREAFHFFRLMELEGIRADNITYASLLDGCSNLASLTQGRKLHARIIELGLEVDVVLKTSMLTMYSRCGRLGEARSIFDSIGEKNVIAWSAMIIAYAQNGDCSKSLQLFWRMEQAGQKPSETTFISVFYACSHAGLVDDAYYYFTTIKTERKLELLPGHYGCIVDLLGRAGRLADAAELIQKMAPSQSGVLWTTLLGACKTHGDIKLAERAAERIRELSPTSATPYVLLSNVYSEAGRWDLAASVRKQMDDMKVKKPAGKSWVEVQGRVHEFVAGDPSHPKIGEIVLELTRLIKVIKEAGYVVDTKAALYNAEEDEKEEKILHYHSEKLAIVMGLLHSPPGEPVQVVKNLRVCSDCHTAAKFISKVVNRQIVVRDTKQFHHFEHGRCSCGDYW